MTKFRLLTCSAMASALLVAGSALADKDYGYDWRYAGPSLQGAWQVETTVRVHADDCSTAPLVPPFAPNPFPSLYTFHDGGTLNEHGSRSSPAGRGTGFGIWERTWRGKFDFRLMFQSFGADGLLSATMDIRTRVSLTNHGDSFEAVSRFVRTDIEGNALNFCATMTGQRITL